MSGPYSTAERYSDVEVADLSAVLAATGASDVLGISSGALIALRAALALPAVARVAAFEPPLAIDGSVRLDLMPRFHRELAAGNLPDAMVTAMLAAEMGPPIMQWVPRPVLRLATRRMLSAPARRPDEPTVAELAAALRVDFAVVTENADRLDDFAALRIPTLLVAGSRTRPYLRLAAESLSRTVPGGRLVTLPGTNHGVTQNRDQWGRPDRIAPALLEFFR
jgi:pimeloyl-ACP methyl ester carboxylesterase